VIPRRLATVLERHARHFPVVTVTGPRQSGKTTLCRATFPGHDYVSLEAPDLRAWAVEDPRGFLEDHPPPVILDEVQRAPDLLSYLQTAVDERPEPGGYILTGSVNLALVAAVSQSLAGRTAVVHLLPLGYDELQRFPDAPAVLDEVLWSGSYPAIFDRKIPPADWYRSYLATYLERDVRQLLNVRDLLAFQELLTLAAGRVGHLVNLSQLGAEAGVSHNTARAWLSVLEASFVVFRLRPYAANLATRVVKSPKLYFYDTGLVCALLGITEPGHLRAHPLRGAIFENWVAAEAMKATVHRGTAPQIFFLRDRKGFEIDLLARRGTTLLAVEVKAGRTIAGDAFRNLERLPDRLQGELAGLGLERAVVYAGEDFQRRPEIRVVPWRAVPDLRWTD